MNIRRNIIKSLLLIPFFPKLNSGELLAPFKVGDLVYEYNSKEPKIVLSVEKTNSFYGGWKITNEDEYGYIMCTSSKMLKLCPIGTKMVAEQYQEPPSDTDILRRYINRGEKAFPFETSDWKVEIEDGFSMGGDWFFITLNIGLTKKRGPRFPDKINYKLTYSNFKGLKLELNFDYKTQTPRTPSLELK
jgi:hypothetical protein